MDVKKCKNCSRDATHKLITVFGATGKYCYICIDNFHQENVTIKIPLK